MPLLPSPERSVFSISASNGVDMARRLTLLGFCYSAEQLFERVEDTVLARGGEVWETQRQLKRCTSARVCVAAVVHGVGGGSLCAVLLLLCHSRPAVACRLLGRHSVRKQAHGAAAWLPSRCSCCPAPTHAAAACTSA